ncbi:glutathione S-transferase family protein [Pseudoxanthomonas wuyuanensis]
MNKPVLVIGNKNYSSWSLRPWLLLRHYGVEFDEVRLNLDTDAFFAEIGRHSPTGKVPVLRDGTLTVWDSLAICEYANERWLQGQGWPDDMALRAQARAAAAEMHSGFAALRTQLPMNSRREPDGYRWDAAADADIQRIQQLWCGLRQDNREHGDFLCGRFGIVDAMFAPVAIRFAGYGVALDQAAAAYVETLFALPAMRQWREAAAQEAESIAATESLRSPG